MGESITALISSKVESKDFSLPVFSSVAMEIQEAIEKDASLAEIEVIILKDQSLAAETLRLANSALFAGLAKQKTVQQALARLGVKRVFNFVVLASQQQIFKAKDPFLNELMQKLWEQATICAKACQWVARKSGYVEIAEDAFLAGLLHDLGSMVVLKAFDEINAQDDMEELTSDVVRDVIESLHTEYGYKVMQTWELPPEYANVARDHHLEQCDPHNALLQIVRLVDAACRKVGVGTGEPEEMALEALEEATLLGIKDVYLAELELELEDSIEELAA